MWWIALACRPDESPPAPAGSTVVRFAPDAPELGAAPFPSDLFRDDDGRIDLGPLPNALDGAPVLDALRGLLADRDGFCATCAVRFGFAGPDGLPARPDLAELDPDAVLVVDLATGARYPLDLEWDGALGVLAARPTRGHVLAAGHPHAAVVTSALRGADGLPVGADDAFAAVLARAPRADARAVSVLGPALDDLRELGIRGVVGLGVFTPEDPTVDLRAVQRAIDGAPLGRPVVDRVWTGAALDELLGVPAEDRPGIDVPAADGGGARAIRHATTAAVVAGRFRAPRFVEGAGADLGLLTRDAAGAPTALVDDDVPFVLIVPAGADVGRLPVVVEHHGFSASRTTAFVLADTAGALGWAVLGVDAYQHGDRAPSALDTVHAMRGGVDGPDGFAETVPLDVQGRVFGLLGTDPDLRMYPGYPLAAFTQFAADASSAIRVAAEGDWSDVAAADPALAGLGFDPDRVVYVGNSMGAVVGTQVVAGDERIAGAVLDVLPGAIVDTLCESSEFRPLSESLLLPALGITGAFDEVDRHLALDPTVDLVRWALEPVDPLALAPWLARDDGPPLLVQLAGHDEVAAPGPSEGVVAAAGIPGVGAFAFADVADGDASAAVVAVRRDGAMHQMLELRDQLSAWDDPLAPPLVARPAPLAVVNPIEDVHDEIGRFLAAR